MNELTNFICMLIHTKDTWNNFSWDAGMLGIIVYVHV